MIDENYTAGLGETDEFPVLAAPAIDNWTENFFWVVNDPENQIGIFLHLGSMRHDVNVVRQSIMVSLPDGRQISDVSVGGYRDLGKVRGATLMFDCLEPFHRWHLTSNGMGQFNTRTDLWNNSPGLGNTVPLKIDINASCLGPVWVAGAGDNIKEMNQQEWASSHYQQTIRLQGTIEIDGTTYHIDGTGWRDHSRGPRDFANWTGHTLFSGPFPDGRSFGLMCVLGAGGSVVYRSAYVVRDGVMRRGVARDVPILSQEFLRKETGIIELDIDGTVETLKFTTSGQGVLVSMLAPYGVTPGLYRESAGGIALSEAMAEVVWDGVIGYGVLERSALTSGLPRVSC